MIPGLDGIQFYKSFIVLNSVFEIEAKYKTQTVEAFK